MAVVVTVRVAVVASSRGSDSKGAAVAPEGRSPGCAAGRGVVGRLGFGFQGLLPPVRPPEAGQR